MPQTGRAAGEPARKALDTTVPIMASEQRRATRNTDMPLADVLEREGKTILALDFDRVKMSERIALITALVKLLAVKHKIGPEWGEAFGTGGESDESAG